MKKIVTLTLLLVTCIYASAQVKFDQYFEDRTLRCDYSFSGDNRHQSISVDELSQSPGWYGRRVNLDSLLLQGNGQITVRDTVEHKVLYCNSFSTLFQEWQTSEEATRTHKAFENCFLVPFPKQPVDITVTLTDTHNRVCSQITHRVDPKDILIRRIGEVAVTPWRYIRQSGDSKEKIDITFVAEGYTADEMETFYKDCAECMDAILSHEPFSSMADRLNFVAVGAVSLQSGISIPHEGKWVNTVLGSNYDTFYSDRYLTTLHLKKLHDVLSGIPYEHIVILANTTNYGGGGIYNSYLMSAAHHPTTRPVVVHEFGHSFAGLADEYYYDDQYETMYPTDSEPWEPNLTTLVNFDSKWKDMLSKKQLKEIPTLPDGKDIYTKVGVYEGGGYMSKGVYRPTQECRMKINEAPLFCPVCQRAIRRMIDYNTK